MPCTDGGFPYPEERPTKSELKALLCDLCQYTQSKAKVAEWPEHLRLWWEAHQVEDASRRERELQSRDAHRAHLRELRAQINAELGDE